MKVIAGRTLYYSSVPNEVPSKTAKEDGQSTPPRQKDPQLSLSPSPRKTIENASSSLTSAVATSLSSAKKIKSKARSFVPRKLLPVQCTPVAKGQDTDESTPVIFYQDEDAATKLARDNNVAFIDPFAFADSDSKSNDKEDKDFSPTSVIPVRLFPDEKSTIKGTSTAEEGNGDNHTFDKNEVVQFDCPVFTNDFKFDEEDTSIDVNSAIKSINAVSISTKDEIRRFRESIRIKKEARDESLEIWEEPILSWDGFTRSTSFIKCEWEPKAHEI